MAEVTVRQLAEQVGIPVDRLLAQLGESGLPHNDADESINEKDRAQLLSHVLLESALNLRRLVPSESKQSEQCGTAQRPNETKIYHTNQYLSV